jgi:hypothetical protein
MCNVTKSKITQLSLLLPAANVKVLNLFNMNTDKHVSYAAIHPYFLNHQTAKIMYSQIKQIAALACLVLCTIGCQSIGKKSTVTIQSKSLDSKTMNETDKFGDKNTVQFVKEGPLSITDHFPKFYTIMLNHKVRAMYVRPENKAITIVDRLNSSGLNKIDSLEFVGVSYPDENIILQEINRQFSVFQGYTLGLYKRSRDLNGAYMSSIEIYKEEMLFVKNAFKKHKTGRDFRKALRREIRYSYICNLIGPFSILGVNVDSISPKYVKTVLGLNKELKNIIRTRRGTDKNVQELVYDYNRFLSRKAAKSDTTFESQWFTASRNFKGETREYLKFKILKENFGATPQYDSYAEQFKKTCKDKDFAQYLDKLTMNNDHVFNGLEMISTFNDTTGQTTTWADILAKNKGKKIYLLSSDFPVQMLFGRQLAEKKADFEKNNTAIVFISTEKNKERWQKDLKKNGIDSTFQYYQLAKADEPIAGFFDKKGGKNSMYSSILIDENGKVTLRQAADPNHFEMLNRQLKVAAKVKVIMP